MNCSEVVWDPIDPTFLLFAPSVCNSWQGRHALSKYFSWSRLEWGGGTVEGWAFASGLTSLGSKRLASAPGIAAVVLAAWVCGTLPKGGTWGSFLCVAPAPAGGPTQLWARQQGSQETYADLDSPQQEDAVPWARVFVAGVKFTTHVQEITFLTFYSRAQFIEELLFCSVVGKRWTSCLQKSMVIGVY